MPVSFVVNFFHVDGRVCVWEGLITFSCKWNGSEEALIGSCTCCLGW